MMVTNYQKAQAQLEYLIEHHEFEIYLNKCFIKNKKGLQRAP